MVDDELQRVVRLRETLEQLGVAALGGGKLAAKLRCEFHVSVVQLGSGKRCRIGISSKNRVHCGGTWRLQNIGEMERRGEGWTRRAQFDNSS